MTRRPSAVRDLIRVARSVTLFDLLDGALFLALSYAVFVIAGVW